MRCLPPSLRLSGDLGALRDYIYIYKYIYIYTYKYVSEITGGIYLMKETRGFKFSDETDKLQWIDSVYIWRVMADIPLESNGSGNQSAWVFFSDH